jgi:hypothetical protein
MTTTRITAEANQKVHDYCVEQVAVAVAEYEDLAFQLKDLVRDIDFNITTEGEVPELDTIENLTWRVGKAAKRVARAQKDLASVAPTGAA